MSLHVFTFDFCPARQLQDFWVHHMMSEELGTVIAWVFLDVGFFTMTKCQHAMFRRDIDRGGEKLPMVCHGWTSEYFGRCFEKIFKHARYSDATWWNSSNEIWLGTEPRRKTPLKGLHQMRFFGQFFDCKRVGLSKGVEYLSQNPHWNLWNQTLFRSYYIHNKVLPAKICLRRKCAFFCVSMLNQNGSFLENGDG